MTSKAYTEILNRAQVELSAEEVQRLAAELIMLAGTNGNGRRAITGLRGLGKELWEGVDPDIHVAQERDSWDG